MKLQPIVEGHGEVEALPVLLRRLRDLAQAYALEVSSPIRRHRDEFFDQTLVRRAVRLALKRDCQAVLLMVDGDGSYAAVFLRHGVDLFSPGDSGVWTPDRGDADFGDSQSSMGGFVRRFATELNVGDVVLLRTGLSRIRAVGLVAGDYLYLNQFDDVSGWDLQHARRTPRQIGQARPHPAVCYPLANAKHTSLPMSRIPT